MSKPKDKRPVAQRLSAPVRAVVLARLRADGYEDDLEAWLADVLATAARAPQGMRLRFGRLKSQDVPKQDGEEGRLL